MKGFNLLWSFRNIHRLLGFKIHLFFNNDMIKRIGGLAVIMPLTVALSLLPGCGSKTSEEQKSIDTTAVDSSAVLLDAVDDFLTKLPRPSEIPNLIAKTGAEFQSNLLNPTANAEKFADNNSKAAFNVGMYGTDVGYLSVYEKSQEAMSTFMVAKKLADKLGISAAFDGSMLERVQKNVGNRDSLIALTDASLLQSANVLKANQQMKEAALLTTGAFVEGLYITCGLIHDYPPTGLPKEEQDKILVPLVKAVIDQEEALGSVINLLKKVNDSDAMINSMIIKLEVAQSIYAKANWPKKMAENKGQLIPTESDIHDLAKAVAEIRNDVIK